MVVLFCSFYLKFSEINYNQFHSTIVAVPRAVVAYCMYLSM
jgi:hypothetical protein